jgi:hypothetical protein
MRTVLMNSWSHSQFQCRASRQRHLRSDANSIKSISYLGLIKCVLIALPGLMSMCVLIAHAYWFRPMLESSLQISSPSSQSLSKPNMCACTVEWQVMASILQARIYWPIAHTYNVGEGRRHGYRFNLINSWGIHDQLDLNLVEVLKVGDVQFNVHASLLFSFNVIIW